MNNKKKNNISIITPQFIGNTQFPKRFNKCETLKHTIFSKLLNASFYILDKQIDGSALFQKKYKLNENGINYKNKFNTECIDLSDINYLDINLSNCKLNDSNCSFYPDHNPIVSFLNLKEKIIIIISWNVEGFCSIYYGKELRDIKIKYAINILNKLKKLYVNKYKLKKQIIFIYCIQELILKSDINVKINNTKNSLNIYNYTLEEFKNNLELSNIIKNSSNEINNYHPDNFTGLMIYDFVNNKELEVNKKNSIEFIKIEIQNYQLMNLDIRPLIGLQLNILDINIKLKIFNIHLIALETIKTLFSYDIYLRSKYHIIELIRLCNKIDLENFLNEENTNNLVILMGDHNDPQLSYLYNSLEEILNNNELFKLEILKFWKLFKNKYNNFFSFYNKLIKSNIIKNINNNTNYISNIDLNKSKKNKIYNYNNIYTLYKKTFKK